MVHAPSQARAILRAVRDGTPPKAMVNEAMKLEDPAQRAMTLAKLAGMGAQCTKRAIQSAEAVERPGQKGEVWETLLRNIKREDALEAAANDLVALPDGTWARDAIIACATLVGRHRIALLEKAVGLKGDRTAAKAVLRAATNAEVPAMRAILEQTSAEDQASLLPLLPGGEDKAIAAAWELKDRTERMEALRVLAWRSDHPTLRLIRKSAEGKEVEERANLLLVTASRADRLKLDVAQRWLAEAAAVINNLPEGPGRKKLLRKLEQSKAHAGKAAPAASKQAGVSQPGADGIPDPDSRHESSGDPDAERDDRSDSLADWYAKADDDDLDMAIAAAKGKDGDAPGRADTPRATAPPSATSSATSESAAPETRKVLRVTTPTASSGSRHVLALVDGYKGGLSNAHLQAVARAAPLCIAFNLDLALVGFPTEDADQLVDLVGKESNIGEGAAYALQLLKDGRLYLNNDVDALPGTKIATTPHPNRPIELEGHGRLTLLMGLGRQGLATRILNGAAGHYEATGQGVSLETATAMGLLADRLGRVPLRP